MDASGVDRANALDLQLSLEGLTPNDVCKLIAGFLIVTVVMGAFGFLCSTG